jgi:predicted GIY-YIG superfamily endonuclease
MLLFEDSYLYTGMTRALHRRRKQHFQGRGKPSVIFKESFPTQAQALEREQQLKGWTRAKKLALAGSRKSDVILLSKRSSVQQRYESLP